MNKRALETIAQAMVADGKGVLAADESTGTIKKRFDSIDVASTEDNRRDYREMLFRTDDAMRQHISGVILFDETLRQKAADGTPLVQVIADTGALPGIKVDAGAKPMAGHDGNGDGRAGRLARPLERISCAWRKIRQMARGHQYRRRPAKCRLPRRQYACACACLLYTSDAADE